MTYNLNAHCATFKLKCCPIVSECWPCTTQSIRKWIGSSCSLSWLNPFEFANTNLPSRVLSLLVILWWCPQSLQYPDVSLGLVVVAASRYVGYFNSFTLSCTVSAFYAQSRSRQEFHALLLSVSQHWELCPLCLFHVAGIWLLVNFGYQWLCRLCFLLADIPFLWYADGQGCPSHYQFCCTGCWWLHEDVWGVTIVVIHPLPGIKSFTFLDFILLCLKGSSITPPSSCMQIKNKGQF